MVACPEASIIEIDDVLTVVWDLLSNASTHKPLLSTIEKLLHEQRSSLSMYKEGLEHIIERNTKTSNGLPPMAWRRRLQMSECVLSSKVVSCTPPCGAAWAATNTLDYSKEYYAAYKIGMVLLTLTTSHPLHTADVNLVYDLERPLNVTQVEVKNRSGEGVNDRVMVQPVGQQLPRCC
ncbi:hypothetical protein Pelo_5085 [Pelomyxa schiedti]|nr:hypothetical protein Pelo_5085 [Pelomyxa schiedti]